MAHDHSIGGRDFNPFGGVSIFGALGLSDFVTATLFEETQNENWVSQTGTKLAEKLGQKLGFENPVIDTKPKTVIDTRVIDTRNAPKASTGKALNEALNGKTQGSLIISPKSNPPTELKKTKKQKVRKTKMDSSHFEYNGVYFEVMTRSETSKAKYTIYKEIMVRILEQFSAAYEIHGRLFVQHLVLSTNHFTDDNAEMTKFRKCLIQSLARNHGAKQTAFVWVREVENVKKQHYHLFVAIDGQKVWFDKTIGKVVKPIVKRSQYFTHVTLAGFHQVVDSHSFGEMIYHASYLAKTRGKGYRQPRANDFGSSRLKPKELAA